MPRYPAATAPRVRDTSPSSFLYPQISLLAESAYAGDTDTPTPPVWSEIAAETLSRSRYVELPGAGHVSTADGFERTAPLVAAFLDDPAAELDRSCVDALPPVDYVVDTNTP